MQVVDILGYQQEVAGPLPLQRGQRSMRGIRHGSDQIAAARVIEAMHQRRVAQEAFRRRHVVQVILRPQPVLVAKGAEAGFRRDPGRSEEHTSELQSLMRISYAVFCLKKKKYHKRT